MTLRISVIGTGYLGATHAACMAEFGHQVIGLDIDPDRVKKLNAGQSPMYEDNLEPLLERHTATGRLRFTTDYAELADWADVHFLCLGTPQGPDGAADLGQLESATRSLAPLLTRPTLVVGKSTVPVGTAVQLRALFQQLAPAGEQVELAWNPEFLREAFAVEDTLRPDRIVFGTDDGAGLELLREVYALPLSEATPVVECDYATAELIKTAANAFLATKISFINAMAQMCQAAGGDVTLLADAIGHDRRIGRQFLNAGLGFGGGCLPKDIRALATRADELGVGVLSDFIAGVEAINTGQRLEMAEMAVDQLAGDVTGKRIAVLGASFKPGTDDTRNSPALTVATALAERGAEIVVYDPQARVDWPGMSQASSVIEALTGADLVLHLTEWPEFRQLDPEQLAPLVTNRIVIDGRLKLHAPTWRRSGWKVVQMGRAATL
ncbi:UDPglucose 6-dehydrogenase [Friedmanniella endophytica]|uniref:UDP-glucose 6-dehydrogenase n=1 Tax=Microlunatus kandeliicorticis TaxID=1759536 RepID=A0A7W3P4U1_9ACTN|nr:UDP-glucose/GDP-mannose dehydrogenase family protein [Microlunatus kandeliicorticis]MBA8793261.1 UDPglucose 6-dehydrogenase [Microlunatus kandeliicorticis]